MKLFRLFLFIAAAAIIGGCTSRSGPGSSIKKGAVYEAQDRTFRQTGY